MFRTVCKRLAVLIPVLLVGVTPGPRPVSANPAPPAGYQFCAWEGEHCGFGGTADVAYGAEGRFNYRNAVSGGVQCINEVFGDPNPGVRKACFIRPAVATPPAGYTFCAWEGEHCAFDGTADVAYGANGRFAYRHAVSGGVQCVNEVFGDPNPGVRKACFIRPAAAPPPADPRPAPLAGYERFCAWEGKHCAFGGTADVAYGANGRFAHRNAVSGGVHCVNEVFGDPNPGVRKACFIRPAAAPPPANPPAPPPQPGCVAGNQVDKPAFFADVARRLRNPSVSEAALPFAVQAFLAWEPFENTAACWNPLATTLRYTRGPCRSQTLPGNTAGVQQYPSRECGIRATADTLNYTFNGNGRAYQAIRRMMAKQAFDEALLLQEVTRWVGSEAYARALVTRWRQLYFGR